jgi:hypothetical protein
LTEEGGEEGGKQWRGEVMGRRSASAQYLCIFTHEQ